MPNIALAAAFCFQLLMLEFIPHWLDASGASQVVVIAYVGAAKAITDLATQAIEWRPGGTDQSPDPLARWACWLSAVALLQVPGLDVPRPAAPSGPAISHASQAAAHWVRRCTVERERPSSAKVLWIAAGTFLARSCISRARRSTEFQRCGRGPDLRKMRRSRLVHSRRIAELAANLVVCRAAEPRKNARNTP